VFTDRPTTVRRGQDRRPGEAALVDAVQTGSIDRVLLWSGWRVSDRASDVPGHLPSGRLALWLDEQGIDTTGSNGISQFDPGMMTAYHLRESRRDRILRGQAASRAMSVRAGRGVRRSRRPNWQKLRMPARGGTGGTLGWHIGCVSVSLEELDWVGATRLAGRRAPVFGSSDRCG
jgi:hypothetical protein